MRNLTFLWMLPLGVILLAYLIISIMWLAGGNVSALTVLESSLSVWWYPLLLGACVLFFLTLYKFNILKKHIIFERAFWAMVAMLSLTTIFGIVISVYHFSPAFIRGGGVAFGISLTAIIFILSKGRTHVDLLQIYTSLGYMMLSTVVLWTILKTIGSQIAYIFSSMCISLAIAAFIGSLLVLLYIGAYKLLLKKQDRESIKFII